MPDRSQIRHRWKALNLLFKKMFWFVTNCFLVIELYAIYYNPRRSREYEHCISRALRGYFRVIYMTCGQKILFFLTTVFIFNRSFFVDTCSKRAIFFYFFLITTPHLICDCKDTVTGVRIEFYLKLETSTRESLEIKIMYLNKGDNFFIQIL